MRRIGARVRGSRSPSSSSYDALSRGDPHKLRGLGLYVWLRAELGVTLNGASVSAWGDQSGFGNNATQPTANVQPTWAASGGPNAGPCLVFTTPGLWLGFSDVFSSLTSAEVFIVRKQLDPPFAGNGGLWHFGTDSQNDHVPYVDGVVYDGFGSTVRKTTGDPTPSLADWHLYNVVTASGEWTSRINGTQHFTTATNTVGFNTSCLFGLSVSAYTEGSIAEIVIFSTVLSTAQRAMMNGYIRSKYRIAVA